MHSNHLVLPSLYTFLECTANFGLVYYCREKLLKPLKGSIAYEDLVNRVYGISKRLLSKSPKADLF